MPVKPKVKKLRAKRQNLRSTRKTTAEAKKEKKERGYYGPDQTTTSYVRAQGKGYHRREGRTAYRAGDNYTPTKKAPEKKKASSTPNLDKRIKKVSKAIKKARSTGKGK